MKNKFDEDELFDQAAREAFKNFELPFEAQDWKRMEKALDEKKHRRLSAIWWYKSWEVLVVSGVFSVLLYTIMPSKQDIYTVENDTKTKNIISQINDEATKISYWDASQAPTANNIIYSAANSAQNIHTQNSQVSSNTDKATNDIYTSVSNNKSKQNNKTKSINANNIILPNTTQQQNNNINNNIFASNTTADESNAHVNSVEEDLILPRILVNHIDAKDAAKIDCKIEPEPDFSLKKIKPLQPYIRQVKLGLLVGAEAHSRTEYGRGAGGYTFGLVAEGEFSKTFALQTGLQVSVRSYEQDRTYTVDNTQLNPDGQGLVHQVKEQRNTQATLLQLPIQLQITCFRNDKWRIYAQTGTNFYLNLSQSYSGSRQTTLSQAEGAVRFTTDIAPRDYEGALLQTGNIQNNAFVNLQLGVGIERQLTDRFCLFVQPNFQYSLTKINQYGDRNNIISLNVGAKNNF